ncbi:MAG: ABC transporter ATP-binding protein [Pseudomonadota bacterium]|nr:ABC transporter ATP-binding protein [Pseudomonadota bacterium]
MAILNINGLEAKFELRDSVVHALRGIDLEIEEGEFFVLLGPSGCGKTTMLRSIAGLERPVAGGILIDGQPVFSTSDKIFVPPDRRPIAMVFQSYAIWPHMDVFENVAFPLRRGRARLGPAELQERVAEVLELLGLETMADRPVTTLSGGQQQRVALARALALRPRVLLMDEPLSNLDFKLQVRLRAQMRELMHRLGLTTIHVTHNQAEALETGDRIAVMDLGKVSQIGDPQTIYHSPENEFVARFIGDMNIYEGTFHAQDGADALVDTPFGRLRARVTAKERFSPGDDCTVGIRPEDIQMNGAVRADGGNEVSGNCTASNYVGEGFVHTVETAGQEIRVKLHHNQTVAKGEEQRLRFPPEHTVLVSPTADLSAEALEGQASLAGSALDQA